MVSDKLDRLMTDREMPVSVQWAILAGKSRQSRIAAMRNAREAQDENGRKFHATCARIQSQCYVRALQGIRRAAVRGV